MKDRTLELFLVDISDLSLLHLLCITKILFLWVPIGSQKLTGLLFYENRKRVKDITVDENLIGAPKMRNSFWYPINMVIYQ